MTEGSPPDLLDEFGGLLTLCNTTPAMSSKLAFADLKKFMDDFPSMAEESLAKQERVLMNQQRWENMIVCERGSGNSQRIRDMIYYMRLGADFDLYSRNVGMNYFDLIARPRFVKLRRRLYKATIGQKR